MFTSMALASGLAVDVLAVDGGVRLSPGRSLALLYLSSTDSTLFKPDTALALSRQAMLLDEVQSSLFVRTCAFAHLYCDENSSALELMRLAIRLGPENRERYEKDLARMLKCIEEEEAETADSAGEDTDLDGPP